MSVPVNRLRDAALDDKYTCTRGRIFLSGIQALVRLPLVQHERDLAAGLNTAGFISGYRGSPLGAYDKNLWAASGHLERHHIVFQPGVNEDLAATAVWGSQQVGLSPGARHDGVFALWYGKGPGVDRSGDVLKHANAAGSARLGGVLALAGDDHACKSSTLPHQSDFAFMNAGMPVLNPAGVQELLDLGLYGFALSRYSGCWVGFKALAEQMDASATVDADPGRVQIRLPEDFRLPEGGLNLRWPDSPPEQEARLLEWKIPAAQAFARANGLDRITHDSPRARLGIAATGKAWLDLLQALEDLGLNRQRLRDAGIRLYRVAMPWPLEPWGARRFAEGLEEVLVVEEKRALVETQLKEQLYALPAARRPRVTGKTDEAGGPLLPATLELSPGLVARAVAARLAPWYEDDGLHARLRRLEALEAGAGESPMTRLPHYCSGCPHNRSTRVPEGSRAMGGIGCHYMAMWASPRTETFTHMGGEGATWIGQAPFTDEQHVFQNLGDGTYYHSGILAIRAAVAAGVSMTYKLLWNEAVAMTGGQPVDGPLDVYGLIDQLRAEGVTRIELLSDAPRQLDRRRLPAGLRPRDRRELETVQRELREVPGVSVLVYVQPCATERRRRRKRGQLPDPPVRVVINENVCEGCGDCGRQSGCLSIAPVETPEGRKRRIDQSSCNKDFSCLEGFCPSFVTLRGATPRRGRTSPREQLGTLPEPRRPALDERPWRILITGVGGTGVVTTSALLGMAAHLDGRAARTLDQTGLAQKFGAVTSHVQIAAADADLHAPRVAAGAADLLLGVDLVVSAGREALTAADGSRTAAVLDTHASMPAAFTREPDLAFPGDELRRRVERHCRDLHSLDASRLAEALVGDTLATNLLLAGYAWQQGLLPLSREAIEQAVRLNGTAVEANLAAFTWGRHAAVDLPRVLRLAGLDRSPAHPPTLEARIRHHAGHLEAYQDRALAERYLKRVRAIQALERGIDPDSEVLTRAVAEGYVRVLAYKDEYEVARQLTDPGFLARLAADFEGDFRLEFHLAPPLLARRDPATGRPRKHRFGPWLLAPLRLLARCRRWRGRWFDPFRYSGDRRLERALLQDYEGWLDRLLAGTRQENLEQAAAIAALPQRIRGYGPVKAEAAAAARREARLLWQRFEHPALDGVAARARNVTRLAGRAAAGG